MPHRGEDPFRDKPTDRQKVISERYAEVIKEKTGRVIDPETIRAVRFVVLKHSERAIFDGPRELEILKANARLNRKRNYAMSLLAAAEHEIRQLMGDIEAEDSDDDDDDDFDDDHFDDDPFEGDDD